MYTTATNPILADFRDSLATLLYDTDEHAGTWAMLLGWVINADDLQLAADYGYDYPLTMGHVRHAHKVMKRLAA